MKHERGSFSIIYFLIISNLIGLIFIPTIAFLLQISKDNIYEKVALNNSFSKLYEQPWTIVSYAFFHTNWLHWLFNMILLYFTGILFLNLFSWKKFLKIYILGGIFGGLFFILAHYLPAFLSYNSQLLGASASIMAILIFLCAYTPEHKIHFWTIKIPLWWLGAFLVVIDILSLPYTNSGGKIAHLGGAFLGFSWVFFVKYLQITKEKRKSKTTKKRQISKKHSEKDFEIQKKIDILLGKISKSGYDSLTNEEKSFLFTASKNLK